MSSSSKQQETGSSSPQKPDDSFLAIIILTIAVIVVITGGIYVWSNRYKLGLVETSLAQTSSFVPPKERQEYISGKKRLSKSITSELNELKKLLMKRALKTIPLLLTLQNEGSSVERLYKRGILTDDLHNGMKELKAFIDQEFAEVQAEADELIDDWGQLIWSQAMQYHQLMLKQNQEKEDAVKAAMDEKKKTANEKKKEKEKTKKAFKNGKESENNLLDAETIKAQEARRLADELIAEEEREKKKKSKGKGGKK